LRLGLLTRNSKAWCSTQIARAIRSKKIEAVCFGFADILARVAYNPEVEIREKICASKNLNAIIVRPIGRGSVDEIFFRLDLLHRLERLGIPIINPPSAIEKAVDKYYALSLLEENGIRVPRTVVTENPHRALKAFTELDEDVVIKPIFGSRGLGITRVTNFEVARRIFRSLTFLRHVLYIQEFISHGNSDIRAFVLGDHVVAAMYRVADNWKTNVSQGAKAVAFQPTIALEKLAVKAAKTLGCEIAGVDIMEDSKGYIINEVNSQPGFRGLQSTTKVDIAEAIVDHVLKFSTNK